MRTKSIIALLLFAIMFVMADTKIPFFQKKKENIQVVSDSVMQSDSIMRDSLGNVVVDTTKMDSLELAIYHHNKAIDDSIRLDSLNRQKSEGINSPVQYSADDSLVYDATSKTAFLYGNSSVKYENMDLASEKIYMNLDSSLVHATGIRDTADTTGLKLTGTPVFTMGADSYESDTMAFNFKTKKGLISSVYTEQQDGFLRSELAKRNDNGEIYLQHGRYTTCDAPHPDFYIALSRAKVRPGKDVIFGPAYLVVADVPLPLAIPYGFFPFTKSYSSGFIMPTYGDESDRGFYLRDGGYYFAVSDKWDLKLLGEIYTKGSWGVSAATTTSVTSIAAVSFSAIRIRVPERRACLITAVRRASRYSGATVRIPRLTLSARCRQASTSPRRAMSATISPVFTIRRRSPSRRVHLPSAGAPRSRASA